MEKSTIPAPAYIQLVSKIPELLLMLTPLNKKAKSNLKERKDNNRMGHGSQVQTYGHEQRTAIKQLYQNILTYGTLENLWVSTLFK